MTTQHCTSVQCGISQSNHGPSALHFAAHLEVMSYHTHWLAPTPRHTLHSNAAEHWWGVTPLHVPPFMPPFPGFLGETSSKAPGGGGGGGGELTGMVTIQQIGQPTQHVHNPPPRAAPSPHRRGRGGGAGTGGGAACRCTAESVCGPLSPLRHHHHAPPHPPPPPSDPQGEGVRW